MEVPARGLDSFRDRIKATLPSRPTHLNLRLATILPDPQTACMLTDPLCFACRQRDEGQSVGS